MQAGERKVFGLVLAVAAVELGCAGGVMPAGAGVVVVVTPHQATVASGGTAAFTAGVTGGATSDVTWSVQEVGGGSVSASGKYTAPAKTGTFHVVATSVADIYRSDAATVTVTAAPIVTVSVSPRVASVLTRGSVAFSATVSGTGAGQSTAVTWSVQEAGGGSVDASGNYTAPGTTGTYHVVAISVADTSKYATATVAVTSTPVIAVSISPQTASVGTAGSLQFTATVTGTTAGQSAAVTWSVQETGGGSVNSSGRYTAPTIAGTYHVVATSVADTSKQDTATVAVTPIAVSIAPRVASTATGGTVAFRATVTGATSGQSTAVTWSVQEAGGGSVGPSGQYTAPATAGTYHVVATSVADTSKNDTATVTVMVPAIAVTISPQTASAGTAGSLQFMATVTGTTAGQSTAVTWSVQETGGGSVDASGHYTAPGTAGTYHVVATSVADTSKSDTATVTSS